MASAYGSVVDAGTVEDCGFDIEEIPSLLSCVPQSQLQEQYKQRRVSVWRMNSIGFGAGLLLEGMLYINRPDEYQNVIAGEAVVGSGCALLLLFCPALWILPERFPNFKVWQITNDVLWILLCSQQLVKLAQKFHHPERAPPIEDMLMATVNLIMIPFFMAWTGASWVSSSILGAVATTIVMSSAHANGLLQVRLVTMLLMVLPGVYMVYNSQNVISLGSGHMEDSHSGFGIGSGSGGQSSSAETDESKVHLQSDPRGARRQGYVVSGNKVASDSSLGAGGQERLEGPLQRLDSTFSFSHGLGFASPSSQDSAAEDSMAHALQQFLQDQISPMQQVSYFQYLTVVSAEGYVVFKDLSAIHHYLITLYYNVTSQ